jgi:glutathione S-transferase
MTPALTLVIGSRNASSWSLRPWLALRQGGLAFKDVVIPLRRPETAAAIARHSPSGKLPVLLVDGRPVWDSLAICELAAELAPPLWPEDWLTRAVARSVAAEMHAGFAELRAFLPMDVTARFGPPGRLLAGVERDIGRILEIWNDCRTKHGRGGPFLFGRFTIADAMFAPVVSRFVTYAVPVDAVAEAYMAAIWELPAMAEWVEAAAREVAGAPAVERPASSSPAADPLPAPAPPAGPAMGVNPRLRPPAADLGAAPPTLPAGPPALPDPPPLRPPAPARAAPEPPPEQAGPAPAAAPSLPLARPPAAGIPSVKEALAAPPPLPAPTEPAPRPERIGGGVEIKPIGDGIRRRR